MDQDKEMKTKSAGSVGMTHADPGPPGMTMPGGPQTPSGQSPQAPGNVGNPGMGMPPSGQPAPSGMMPTAPYPAYYGGPYWGGPQVGGMGMPYGWPYGMPFNPNVNLFCDPRNYVWQGMQGGFGGGMMMPFCPPVMPQQHCGHGGGCHGRSMCGCRSACCRRPPCQRGCGCC